MDNIENTPNETEDISFGKEIAKTLIISTATSAGVLLGFAAVGLTVQKIQKIREARKAKKDQEEN